MNMHVTFFGTIYDFSSQHILSNTNMQITDQEREQKNNIEKPGSRYEHMLQKKREKNQEQGKH